MYDEKNRRGGGESEQRIYKEHGGGRKSSKREREKKKKKGDLEIRHAWVENKSSSFTSKDVEAAKDKIVHKKDDATALHPAGEDHGENHGNAFAEVPKNTVCASGASSLAAGALAGKDQRAGDAVDTGMGDVVLDETSVGGFGVGGGADDVQANGEAVVMKVTPKAMASCAVDLIEHQSRG